MTSTPTTAPDTGERVNETPSRTLRLLALDSLEPAGSTDSAREIFRKPPELGWWDWAVFLLHVVAEIEHALLVQYLYAAFSLRPGLTDGDAPGARQWRGTIVRIAVQEMGHLLTEQNILWAIGGPLDLAREDFPLHSRFYPFPFMLEPLSKKSLAKYVAGEMPDKPDIPADELRTILDLARGGRSGQPVNRVGTLFDTLVDVFTGPDKLPDSVFRPGTATTLQGRVAEWHGGPIIVRTIESRDQARAALEAIGREGEGADTTEAAADSHFSRFLQIYREFPANGGSGLTRDVPVNPNTLPDRSRDPATEAGRITHPRARAWAALFNLRYRMLLVDLAHALRVPHPSTPGDRNHPRTKLKDWTFQEMHRLGPITEILVGLPLTDAGNRRAGPPFELPYTLALPDVERDRWHLHRVLLDTSAALVAGITAPDQREQKILTGITTEDTAARRVVDEQLERLP